MRGRRDPRGLIVRCAGALASATGIVGLLGLAPIQWPGALALTAGGLAVALLTPRVRRATAAREDTAQLQSMAEAVVVFDAEGRVVEANQRWYELIGLADGGSVATYMDITDRRKTEDALAEQAATLERTNEHLQDTNRRLERAAAFKNDLMALVSHEMSQPLSSSASLAELLADSWDQLPEETRLDLTIKIHRNTRRLVGMVNDMLLLFHLDSGTVTARRTPVPVSEVVDLAAAALPAGAEISTRIEPAADALVDRNHLEQIIGNLLGNAVAYGEPPIEVAARLDAKGVLIIVTDHGSGIPEEIRPHLFDRAVRPKATGTGSGRGRGLGLFIARHLAEVNGGTIWYEDARPHGARLLVRLESTATE
ncbi:MAG: hypothetical protein AUI14_18835 [Actinobacteria bacterium 13_2_20CM_2_71_6]|nr:MAG: hypothetical protein AUI14_18835 [Actinobacteria bacterium 13_2_20CM_2_71_6]